MAKARDELEPRLESDPRPLRTIAVEMENLMKHYTLSVSDENGTLHTQRVSHTEYVMLKNMLRPRSAAQMDKQAQFQEAARRG